MANKPNIRFKGFTDDWEQRKLGEWGEFYYGRSCPKWSVTEDAITPCVRYGELYTKFGSKIDEIYSYTNMPVDNLRFSKGNEVLIPRVGEDPMDYNHCTWLSIPGVAIGEMISVFNTTQSPLFSAIMFNATLQREFAMRVEGGSVTNLYYDKLKNIDVLYPTMEEQKEIARYFSTLDHLITLHQRKCDETKKLKKFMLQKMFPKNGEKNPEIRFAGFTDDWEQRKVEDIMSCVTDYVAAGSFADIKNNVTYLTEPDYAQLVRTVDLKKKFANTDYVFVDKNAFDYLWRVNLNEDCIVLPNIGANIGEVYYVEPSELPQENNVLGPNAILLKTEEEKYFIFTSLTTDDFQRQLFENVGSSGQPKFNKTELKNISLWLPSVEEQKKIGDTLRNLDHLITLHQRKCDKLKLIKKFMLQNMFPKKG